MVSQTSIEQSCAEIENSDTPLALRFSGQLLLGLVRIYDKKVRYLQEDATEALTKIKILQRRGGKDGNTIEIIEMGRGGKTVIRGRGVVSLADDQLRAPVNQITNPSYHDIYDFNSTNAAALDDVLHDHYISVREAREQALAAVANSIDAEEEDLILDMSYNNNRNIQSTPLRQAGNIARASDISIQSESRSSFGLGTNDNEIDLLRRERKSVRGREVEEEGELDNENIMDVLNDMAGETGVAVPPEEEKEEKMDVDGNVSIDQVREARPDADLDEDGLNFDNDDSMDVSQQSILTNKKPSRDSILPYPEDEPGTAGSADAEMGDTRLTGVEGKEADDDFVAPDLTSSEAASLRRRPRVPRGPRRVREQRDHPIELSSAFIAACQRNTSDIAVDRVGTESLLAPEVQRQRRRKQFEVLAGSTTASQHASTQLFQLGSLSSSSSALSTAAAISLHLPSTPSFSTSSASWAPDLQSFTQQFLTTRPLNFIGQSNIIVVEENEQEEEEEEKAEEKQNQSLDSSDVMQLAGPEDVGDDFTQVQSRPSDQQSGLQDAPQEEDDEKTGTSTPQAESDEKKAETVEEKQDALARRIEAEAAKAMEALEAEDPNITMDEEEKEQKEEMEDDGLNFEGVEGEPLFIRRESQENDAEREARLQRDLADLAKSSKLDALAAKAASRFFSDPTPIAPSSSSDSQSVDSDLSATGFGKRTVKMHAILRDQFEGREPRRSIGFSQILKSEGGDADREEKKEESVEEDEAASIKVESKRNIAAGVFYQLLVLSSHGYITTSQPKPFEDIQVERTADFDSFRSGSQSSQSSQLQSQSRALSQKLSRSSRSSTSTSDDSSVPESEREEEQEEEQKEEKEEKSPRRRGGRTSTISPAGRTTRRR